MIEDDDLDFEPLRGKPSIFMQAAAEHALQETGARFSALATMIAMTRACRPDHPSLSRADAKLAEFDREIISWLAAWVPDHRAN